jgi:O-antigen/teichoic acid export membrane protein
MAEISTNRDSGFASTNPETRGNLHLTSGRLLARNTLWNLAGNGAPLLVAVFSIPILIRGLGKDRFGVLTLAWALIGYASLFDIGLGRALTQLVAKKLGGGEDHEIPALAWTSLLLMLALGAVGTVVIVAVSPWLVHHGLKIPIGIQPEVLRSFYLLGLAVPAVIATAGLRGLLEAHQRFDLVTALRIPTGVFTFLGPLLALPFSRSLVPVVGILVAGRFLGCLAHLLVCFRVVPELRRRIAWHGPSAGPLLRFGSWMTVTNIVGPLMVTLDRFLIAGLISVTAVTYYATPYEVVTKLLLIPVAVMGVIFPAFSASFAQDRNRAALLFGRSVKYVLLALFPIVLLIVALAQNGLTVWLGADFAQHSTRVVQWLAVGVLANSLALVPFSFVQGIGRPDLTAKLHLSELPIYIGVLLWLIRADGIEGAAIAWSARSVFDALAMFLIARRFLPAGSPMASRTKVLLAVAVVTLFLAVLPQELMLKAAFLLVAILSFVLVTWFLILTPEERSLAHGASMVVR